NAFGTIVSSNATITLLPANGVSYVWPDSPNPTPPYSNWVTAAHTITDAISAVGSGYRIVVTNGTYAGTVTIDKPLTLVSVNGPQVTIIEGSGNGNRCASLTNGASLTGFTLRYGGPGGSGGGVWCATTNAF